MCGSAGEGFIRKEYCSSHEKCTGGTKDDQGKNWVTKDKKRDLCKSGNQHSKIFVMGREPYKTLNLRALLKVLNYLFLVVCLGGWKQTGGCDPDGVRESQFDKTCGTTIASGWSGYCDCEKGRVKKTCASWSFKNCNEACM